MPSGNTSLFLTIAMLAVFVLVAGGIYLFRRSPADRRRGGLMVVAAIVLLGNVLILTWPMPK